MKTKKKKKKRRTRRINMADKQNLVFLEYSFLFDAEATFGHLYEFEKLLFDFFNSRNLVGEVIKSMEGNNTKRLVFVAKKVEQVDIGPAKAPPGRPVTLKGQIKRLSERKLRKPAEEFKERKMK